MKWMFRVWMVLAIISTSEILGNIISSELPLVAIASTNDAVAVWQENDDTPSSTIHASTLSSANFSTNTWNYTTEISIYLQYSQNPIMSLFEYTSGDTTLVTAVVVWISPDPSSDTGGALALYYSVLENLNGNTWSVPNQVNSTSGMNAFKDYKLSVNASGNVALIWSAYDNTGTQVIQANTGTFTTSPTVSLTWHTATQL